MKPIEKLDQVSFTVQKEPIGKERKPKEAGLTWRNLRKKRKSKEKGKAFSDLLFVSLEETTICMLLDICGHKHNLYNLIWIDTYMQSVKSFEISDEIWNLI